MNTFAERLLAWHARHGRHDLPWQQPRTAYRVWLSEIMLQQTQVATVIPYFHRFVEALPSLSDLAAADLDRVIALWSGLGYYNRARNLHRSAQICLQEYGGVLPADFDALHRLPGIGRSTAGAILAQAFGLRHAILDGNTRRVLCRWHGIDAWPGHSEVQARLWALAESLLPSQRMPDYTQAQMDLGATVCTRSKPDCATCPLRADCVALARGMQSQWPVARARPAKPERSVWVLLLHDRDDRLLLHKRPPTGVWPSLWSLPEAPTAEAAGQLAARLARLPQPPLPLTEPIRHSFTHFNLRITPLVCTGVQAVASTGDNPDLAWVERDEVGGRGLPAPIRRLIGRLPTALEIA